jgi:arabinan endo-1,5-alpha-L-arabinosidase
MDYMLMRQREGELELAVGQLDSEPVSVLSTGQTDLNEWSHVAVCLNGSEMTIYVNGQPDVSANYGRRVPREGHRLVISSYQADTRFYNGKIDEVRIYNIALSEQEVGALYDEASN